MPSPQPSAMTRSDSSLFSSTFASDALSVLSTLPRSGRIACRIRSRPCFAEPPAESPSTMKISVLSRSLDEQSVSLPGSARRAEVAVLRVTSCCAARLASRARAARMMRATTASATLMLWFIQCSSAGRTVESIAESSSGLFSRSLVWPWNCGSARNTLRTPVRPSRMSSAVSVTPFGDRLCVSMKFRTALPTPARRPFSCVPPDPVGMPFA